MSWIENLLIIAGISLDVFAAMEIQGAMIANLKRKTILMACGVVAGLELVFYLGAYAFCRILVMKELIANPENYGETVAVVILFLLGIRLIVKAIKREFIQEHRKDSLIVWDYIRIVVVSNIYTAAAGCACGLLGTTVWQLIALILVISILMVLGGLYTGLHFGFEKKTIAYVAGALLLWGVGVEIFLTSVVKLI